jgi:unspecific monooxygenase
MTPAYLAFDPTSRRLRLDPHEPAFVQNPYEAYAFLHGTANAFFWKTTASGALAASTM